MISPQQQPSEKERLIALRRLNILDTPPEARFDRVTRLAARLFSVPYAAVSLVDEDRQWFKSRHAFDLQETPREDSICTHTILQDEPLVILNAAKDLRFCEHSSVTGERGIRFYAGCPLRTAGGHRVGTLCVFDVREREFTDEDIAHLKELAAIVEGELDAVILDEALLLTSSLQKAFLDSMDACIIATDLEGKIVRVNSAGERMLGYSSAELTGGETLLRIVETQELERRTAALVESTNGAVTSSFQALLHRGASGAAPERSWTYVRKDGSEFPVRLSIIPLQTDAGSLTGYLTVARDITREKEVEQTMLAAKDAAEHASETKSRFLANMSHEIRTPLNGIIGVNTMLLEGELTPEQSRLAGIVQESAESLLNIVDDILDFSKVEAGLIELEERPFSL
ncbi:MAG: histidine kinase dimerization/phospho-acceptor domain-containing protein, partial [Chthoniobacteraceae bacterium]